MANQPNHPNLYHSLKAFQEYLDYIQTGIPESELEDLYDEPISIEFNGHSVTIPFNADTFDSLYDLVTTALMEV